MMTNEQGRVSGLDLLAAARRRWGVPALALTLLAGTSTGLAQDGGGFGLLDAVKDQAAAFAGQPTGEPAPAAEPVDFTDLEGSVSVNEYDLVDLHVNNEDLGAVLQLLSIQSQRNIISSNAVQATLTADLYGVTFYEALDAVLHVNGFGYIEKGNFIYVYTREELEEFERLSRKAVSRVIHLDYLNAKDAAEFAKHLISETGAITTNAESGEFTLNEDKPGGADTYANSATIVVRDFEENVEEIAALIAEIDTKPVQVLVEATILQTSLTESNAFGMDFAIISDMDFADFLGSGGPLSVVDGLIDGKGEDISGAEVPATGTDGDGAAIGSNIGNVTGPSTLKVGVVSEDVSVFLRVLDQVTDVTVVSNPKLLTLNRQPARVLVGTKVGYLNTTTTETATTQTVEFLDVGTQLAVRPFVSKNGLIRLELRPQVSSFALREVTDNSGSTVTIPDEDTTEMSTNVMLRDGQTAVLGGLFTETTTSTRRQVPLLGDIPLIGSAFRGNDDSTRRSEIIFLITPSIVNDDILADHGHMGQQYLEAARVGARKSLLPFSRERRVGQLLIEARRVADDGDNARALFLVERALRLSPMSPDARLMKAELSNETERMPSRGMMNGILHRELLSNETPLVQFQSPVSAAEPIDAGTDTVFEPVLDSGADNTEGTFSEVPVEPVSFNDTGSDMNSDMNSNEAYDSNWLTAEVESGPVSDAGTQPTYVEISPEQMLRDAGFGQTANANQASTGADRFDAMRSVTTAQTGEENNLPLDWYDWNEGEQEFTQVAGSTESFGGFLVIPLPGGGALHVDWPMNTWDWNNTFTEVPTGSFENGVE